DEPEVVEECLAVMQARDEETVRISVNTAADGFIFWEDSSTTNISPAMFAKYTKPEIDRWGELVHGAGKLLVHHACGHLKDLLPLMARSNIDAIESISPPPTGNVTLQEAAAILPEHIALIGGLEPVRQMSHSHSVVMDGRDIGTTVFPNADIKLYVTSSPEVRARRRHAELMAKGEVVDYDTILKNITERDYIDSSREVSPLVKAADAIEIDNSSMSIDEQNTLINSIIEKHLS
ncbi:MAG: (d)CMP kinase, partial [Flavobacteriales bacterium]|nr:(d)CMP kinase [Flavobacteriales bacterium]